MTPAQKTEFVLATVKQARQNTFTREQFVAMTNRIWDALEGAELDAQMARTLASVNGVGNFGSNV